MKNKWLILLKIIFVLAVTAVICRVLGSQWREIIGQLKQITWVTIVLLLLCSIFFNVFEGLCYYTMGKKYNKKMRIIDGIGCSYYCGFFKLSTLGSGTAASGMYYLSQKDVEVSKSFGMITINYMMQKVSIAIFCLICFSIQFPKIRLLYHGYFRYLILGMVLTGLVATGLLLLVLCEKLHRFIIFLGNKIAVKDTLRKYVSILEDKLSQIREGSREILKDRTFMIKIFAFNMCKYLGWYMIPCVVSGYDSVESIFLGITISSIASALVGVIPSPGALGSTEAMFYTMFLVVVSKSEAITIMLLYRFFTYIVPFIIGGIYILIRKIRNLKVFLP